MPNNLSYKQEIENLINSVDNSIIDLSIIRERSNAPTQASSEFLTNKQQGDWAEITLQNAINGQSQDYIAVKYGLDIDSVAGDEGFKEFYNQYQDELDTIGKKPDLLIFNRRDYNEQWGLNISALSEQELEQIVSLAVCGIEVRSSSFKHQEYEDFMINKVERLKRSIITSRDYVIENYSEVIRNKKPELLDQLAELSPDNLHTADIKFTSWKNDPILIEISELIKGIKSDLKELKKRDYLSMTPKVEDIKVVYNWIQKFNIPHFYVQVFFDSAYAIAFKDIVAKLRDGQDYSIERDVKNQNKSTIKIDTRKCTQVMRDISVPNHSSRVKELGDRGRLMFYVKFEPSQATLTPQINEVLGCEIIR